MRNFLQSLPSRTFLGEGPWNFHSSELHTEPGKLFMHECHYVLMFSDRHLVRHSTTCNAISLKRPADKNAISKIALWPIRVKCQIFLTDLARHEIRMKTFSCLVLHVHMDVLFIHPTLHSSYPF